MDMHYRTSSDCDILKTFKMNSCTKASSVKSTVGLKHCKLQHELAAPSVFLSASPYKRDQGGALPPSRKKSGWEWQEGFMSSVWPG